MGNWTLLAFKIAGDSRYGGSRYLRSTIMLALSDIGLLCCLLY